MHMEENTTSNNSLSEAAKALARVSSSNEEPVSEEIVIYDECGDTLWDKVLAQNNKMNNPEKQPY